jgi:hypothetical protein
MRPIGARLWRQQPAFLGLWFNRNSLRGSRAYFQGEALMLLTISTQCRYE